MPVKNVTDPKVGVVPIENSSQGTVSAEKMLESTADCVSQVTKKQEKCKVLLGSILFVVQFLQQ